MNYNLPNLVVVVTEGNTYVEWFCFVFVEFWSLNSRLIFVFIFYNYRPAVFTILFNIQHFISFFVSSLL